MVNESKDDDLHDREHSPLDSESNPGAIDDETFARAYQDALNDEIKKKATNLAKKTLREQERKAAREKWKSENPDLDKFLQFNLKFSAVTKIAIAGFSLLVLGTLPIGEIFSEAGHFIPQPIGVAFVTGAFGSLLVLVAQTVKHQADSLVTKRKVGRAKNATSSEHEWKVFRSTGKFTGNLLHEYEAEQKALQKIGVPSHMGRLGKELDEWQRTRKNKRLIIAFLCIVAVLLFGLSRLV